MQASAILTIARWELATHLRNRWVWTVGLLFLLAALTIAFFGSAPVGMARGQSGGAVLASLMNLSVYLVPLLALILGAGAIIDEKRRGTLDLILAYPVTPSEFFFGSFLGYGAALWLALLASFIPAGIAVMAIAAVDPLEYLRLVAVVLILGAVFLALAILLSLLSRNHDRGMASSMLLWIVAVFVFDLVLVGVLVLAGERIPPTLFGYLLLLNPTDVFRLLCFSWVGSAASPLGLAAVSPPFPAVVLVGVLLAWIVVPLLISQRLFHRRLGADNLV